MAVDHEHADAIVAVPAEIVEIGRRTEKALLWPGPYDANPCHDRRRDAEGRDCHLHRHVDACRSTSRLDTSLWDASLWAATGHESVHGSGRSDRTGGRDRLHRGADRE